MSDPAATKPSKPEVAAPGAASSGDKPSMSRKQSVVVGAPGSAGLASPGAPGGPDGDGAEPPLPRELAGATGFPWRLRTLNISAPAARAGADAPVTFTSLDAAPPCSPAAAAAATAGPRVLLGTSDGRVFLYTTASISAASADAASPASAAAAAAAADAATQVEAEADVAALLPAAALSGISASAAGAVSHVKALMFGPAPPPAGPNASASPTASAASASSSATDSAVTVAAVTEGARAVAVLALGAAGRGARLLAWHRAHALSAVVLPPASDSNSGATVTATVTALCWGAPPPPTATAAADANADARAGADVAWVISGDSAGCVRLLSVPLSSASASASSDNVREGEAVLLFQDDSAIVQLACEAGVVLVSSLTKTTALRLSAAPATPPAADKGAPNVAPAVAVRPIGSQSRFGAFGACFLPPPPTAAPGSLVLAARKGRRLWVADSGSGQVLTTLRLRLPVYAEFAHAAAALALTSPEAAAARAAPAALLPAPAVAHWPPAPAPALAAAQSLERLLPFADGALLLGLAPAVPLPLPPQPAPPAPAAGAAHAAGAATLSTPGCYGGDPWARALIRPRELLLRGPPRWAGSPPPPPRPRARSSCSMPHLQSIAPRAPPRR